MVERFVSSEGTISVAYGSSTVVGVGTLFSGRDREGAQVWVTPLTGSPYKPRFCVGTVAAVDPRGVYNDLSLPLLHPWYGEPVVNKPYELVDGPAIYSPATQDLRPLRRAPRAEPRARR
jgi:hypothetical protein